MKNKLPELILIALFVIIFTLGLWVFNEVHSNIAKLLVFLVFAFIELIVLSKMEQVNRNK